VYVLNDWDISDGGQTAEDVLQNGNRLLTGNGYLGRRGVVDEAEAADMPATILAGLYDCHGDKWREPVNAPDPLYVLITAGDQALRADSGYTHHHEQALNFRYGIYTRTTTWRLSAGKLTAKVERFAHMEDVHLLCMRYTLCADTPCRLVIKHGINSTVKDLNGPHLGNFMVVKPAQNSVEQNVLGLSCTTLEQKIPLGVFSAFVLPLSGNSNAVMQTQTSK